MPDPQWGLLVYMIYVFLVFFYFLVLRNTGNRQLSTRAVQIRGVFGEGGSEVVGRGLEVVWEGGSEGSRRGR